MKLCSNLLQHFVSSKLGNLTEKTVAFHTVLLDSRRLFRTKLHRHTSEGNTILCTIYALHDVEQGKEVQKMVLNS